ARNFPSVYRLENYEWRVISVLTNRSPIGPYRAVGSTAASTARDLFFHRIASELGLDVVDFLRRNMIRAHEMPYTTATGQTYDSGSYIDALDAAVALADYGGFRRRQAELRERGVYIGIGIAPFVEATAW